MEFQQLEKAFTSKFGWLIALAMVAGSSFLLGTQTQPKAESTPVVESTQPQNDNLIIGDIQESLNSREVAADSAPPVEEVVEMPEATSGLVSINTGTVSDLDQLPGIGPVKAQAIIDYRNQFGPFVRVEDLVNVKGIGSKTMEDIRSQIVL